MPYSLMSKEKLGKVMFVFVKFKSCKLLKLSMYQVFANTNKGNDCKIKVGAFGFFRCFMIATKM